MSQASAAASGGRNNGSSDNDLDEVRTTLTSKMDKITIRTDEQHNFIEGLRHVVTETWMSSAASKEILLELFPPDVLLHASCLKLPLLFRLMREVLQFVGMTVESRQGLYVPIAVAHSLYEDDQLLKDTADGYISEYKHAADTSSRSGNLPGDTATQDSPQNTDHTSAESTWRRVDAANRRFNVEDKYSGILAQSPNLSEVRNAYITYCNQKDFLRPDRVRLISCVLKGPAFHYWTSKIDGRPAFNELGAVFRELEYQFDTPAHQRQIESLALSLTMESIREKQSCSRIAALGRLYHEVARLNEQFPKVKRGPVFRTQTLMAIVEKYEWSRTSEEEVMQDKIDYDALYTKLSGSIVIWESEVKRAGKDPDRVDDRRSLTTSAPVFIGYSEQYANLPPKRRFNSAKYPYSKYPPSSQNQQPRLAHVNRRQSYPHVSSSNPSSRYHFRADNQANVRCWKCGRLGHFRATYTFNNGSSMVNAARAPIKELGGDPNKAAARVLYEIVQDEDQYACHNFDETVNLFDTLVVSQNENESSDLNDVADNEDEKPSHESVENQVFLEPGGENQKRTHSSILPAAKQKELNKNDEILYCIDCLTELENPEVHYIQDAALQTSRRNRRPNLPFFQGSVLDIGAQKSVVGLDQALAYCRDIGLDLKFDPSNATFVFGDQAHRSLGRLNILLPTPSGRKPVSTLVVKARIPFLIGLDTLDKYQWNVLTTENRLQSAKENWFMPLKRKHGHVFLEWKTIFQTLYNRQQLQNMHLHFMHPSTSKLFNLLKRAYPHNVNKDTKDLLDNVTKSCHACQTYASRPWSFKVRFPGGIVFNQRVSMDLMYLNGKPVLHVVDLGTNFSAARFLSGEDAKTGWQTFVYMWVTIYTGYPNGILTDQGSVFTSKEWIGRCKEAEISIDFTGTESHNSLGQGETYHAILRRVYNKVTLTHPSLPRELSWALSVKAINDTAGPNGLVPSFLLFGVLPRIPGKLAQRHDANDRIRAIETARNEYETAIAKSRVRQALSRRPPESESHVFMRDNQSMYTGRS